MLNIYTFTRTRARTSAHVLLKYSNIYISLRLQKFISQVFIYREYYIHTFEYIFLQDCRNYEDEKAVHYNLKNPGKQVRGRQNLGSARTHLASHIILSSHKRRRENLCPIKDMELCLEILSGAGLQPILLPRICMFKKRPQESQESCARFL